MAVAILVILALVGVNMLLLLVRLGARLWRHLLPRVLPRLWWIALDFRHGDQLLQDRAGHCRAAHGNGAPGRHRPKAASIRDAAAERIADTTGGKIAAAIRARAESDQAGAAEAVPTFGDNNLAGADSAAADPDDEVAAFANREHGKSEA
jgi:hypothetical protein